MGENSEIIHRNPKLAKSFRRSIREYGEALQKSGDKKHDKPNVVSIPVPEVVAPPPIEVKRRGNFSHPVIRWSLYALGGYLIVRWAWKKWKPEDDEDKK